MKYKIIRKVLVVCMVIVILSGCSNNINTDNNLLVEEDNNLPVIEENKELSGTLTVSTVFDGYIDLTTLSI